MMRRSPLFVSCIRSIAASLLFGAFLAVGIALPGGIGSAQALTLDFDVDDTGSPLSPGAFDGTSAYDMFGITITGSRPLSLFNANCGPDFGVACSGGDADLATGPTYGTAPQGNVLIIQNPNAGVPDDFAGGGTITFDFAVPTTLAEITLLDNDNGAGIFLEIFQQGDLTPTTITPSLASDNDLQIIAFGAAGFNVVQLVVNLPGSGAVASLTAVPLPAALPLFLAALAWLGWFSRRPRGTRPAAAT